MADLPLHLLDARLDRLTSPPRTDARKLAIDGSTGVERLARLAQVIGNEVIPRLVLARQAHGVSRPGPTDALPPSEEEIRELAALVVEHDVPIAALLVDRIRARGVPVETVYLDLLAPAARHLGELWNADLRTFSEVTLGLWRLQQLVFELDPAFQAEAIAPSNDLRALLVPVPGEQHSFGLSIVAEFFRRAGWLVAGGPLISSEELLGLVHREWFAVVGISVASCNRLELLATIIRKVRRASRNHSLGILVGGAVFTDHPERVAMVGADAGAVDARQAPAQARAVVDLLAHRR